MKIVLPAPVVGSTHWGTVPQSVEFFHTFRLMWNYGLGSICAVIGLF